MKASLIQTQPGAVAARLLTWRRDPVRFCVEVLGFCPWDSETIASQADVLRACAFFQRVSTRSGHKVGKSRTGAALALWEFVCWPGSRTVLTAPSARQVKEVLWREISLLWSVARKRLRAMGLDIPGELAVDPGTGLRDRVSGTQVVGFSTNDPDKFSGFSEARVTYIVDEASGVDEAIFTALKGNMGGGARLIMFSNPTQPAGTFYDSHHDSSNLYVTFHLNSERVALEAHFGRIKGVDPRMLGMAKLSWVYDMREEFGRDTAEYDVRVRGRFAAMGADGIVPLGLVRRAMACWQADGAIRHASKRLVVGLDVARFGDDESVAVARRGNHVLPPQSWRQLDSIELAAAAVAWVRELRHASEGVYRPKPLLIVDSGGPGGGVIDQLEDKWAGEVDVLGVSFSEKADDASLYVNRRAQIWFAIRSFLRRGGTLPKSRELRTDLTAVRYEYDKENRYKAEPKKKVKKRLGRSPDYGDAMALCAYQPRHLKPGVVNLPSL